MAVPGWKLNARAPGVASWTVPLTSLKIAWIAEVLVVQARVGPADADVDHADGLAGHGGGVGDRLPDDAAAARVQRQRRCRQLPAPLLLHLSQAVRQGGA